MQNTNPTHTRDDNSEEEQKKTRDVKVRGLQQATAVPSVYQVTDGGSRPNSPKAVSSLTPVRGSRSLTTVGASYWEAVQAAKTRDPSVSASLLAAGGRCDDMLFFQIGISESLRRTQITLEVLRLLICCLTIFICISLLHAVMFVLKHAVLLSPGIAAISELVVWFYGSDLSEIDVKSQISHYIDRFILYMEHNIIFTSTAWCYMGFRHPLFSLLGSMLLLISIAHLKRNSQLLDSPAVVDRLNTAVLEPSFGLRYDLRSAKLLVRIEERGRVEE